MRRRRTGRATVAIGVAVVLAVAACGGDGGGDERSQPSITAPPTSSTTATTAPPEPERVEVEAPPGEPRPDIDVNVTYPSDFTDEQVAVVEAYRGYLHAYLVAADPVDPDHPLIARYATVERAAGVAAGLQGLQDRGVVGRLRSNGQYMHAVLAVRIDGSNAVIHVCSVDDGILVSARDGRVVDDSVVTREGEFTVTNVNEAWKVSGTQPRVLSEEPGVSGCAEQLS